METITKNDDVSVKITTPVEEVVSLVDLKHKVFVAQTALDSFENWVILERQAKQKVVDDAVKIVSQAESLGVVDTAPASEKI